MDLPPPRPRTGCVGGCFVILLVLVLLAAAAAAVSSLFELPWPGLLLVLGFALLITSPAWLPARR